MSSLKVATLLPEAMHEQVQASHMKVEWATQIKIAARQMHLSAETTARLRRWSDRAADLRGALYARVTTEADWKAANRKASALIQAHSKAELRVLGGSEGWNRYTLLRAESTGEEADVFDDRGNLRWPTPARLAKDARPIVICDHFGPNPEAAQFDRYFAD